MINLGLQTLECKAHTHMGTHACKIRPECSVRSLGLEEANETDGGKEVFYRGLQIVVFMRLGSRYTVASGGNERCFVPWLIYTWPWRGSFSFSGCSIALPFTFSRPCDRLTSKQIPRNYSPWERNIISSLYLFLCLFTFHCLVIWYTYIMYFDQIHPHCSLPSNPSPVFPTTFLNQFQMLFFFKHP